MMKILILGGGFGGIRCALDLEKNIHNLNKDKQFEITLVDKNGYHLFTPGIYEFISAYGLKKDLSAIELKRSICIPYSDIFEGKDINFIQTEVTDINIKDKKIKTSGSYILDYDYLVIALGGEPADFGITGVKEYAGKFKNLQDVFDINQKLKKLADQFIKYERTEPYSFAICGGGFAGIELAAELSCYSRIIKRHHSLKRRFSTITLFDAGSKILPMVSEQERELIKERLTVLGIVIMENSLVEEVGSDYIKLKNGHKTKEELILWTTGVRPVSMLNTVSDFLFSANGRIKTDQALQTEGCEKIFGIGDNIEFIDPKTLKPVPALAYIAIAQGKIVAKNILHLINNENVESFIPPSNIWILPMGDRFALAHLWGGLRINGFMGWIVHWFVSLGYLLSIFSIRKTLKVFWRKVVIFSGNY